MGRQPVNQSRAAWARACLARLEWALGPDVAHWPWSRRLSLWVDALQILLSESSGEGCA
jgi:hypothetical protein